MEKFDLSVRNDTARAVFMLTALLGQEITISSTDDQSDSSTGVLVSVTVGQYENSFVLDVTLNQFKQVWRGEVGVSIDSNSPEPFRLLGDAVMALKR